MPKDSGSKFKHQLHSLKAKGLWYWISAVLLIVLGTYVGNVFSRSQRWVDLRYALYQYETKGLRPKSYDLRTVIVLIGDDEYWRGKLARRAPIKRDYLAKLVRAMDACDPAIIALDFDLRSPTPNGELRDNLDYSGETATFLQAVKDVSLKRPVVLPKTIGLAGKSYFAESDIDDGYDFGPGNVLRGYISLPYDKREVPLTLPVQGFGTLDSFAQAIVKADNKTALEGLDVPSYSLPFGSFMDPTSFAVVPAQDILNGVPDSGRKLAHKIAIVGAGWSRLALGRGGKVDSYASPAGTISGVFLHANYVEALIGEHIYHPWGEEAAVILDVVLAVSLAILFALEVGVWWKLGVAFVLSLSLIVFSYFSLQNLGAFFDFFVPSILILLHAFIERVREWRQAYHQQQEVRI
jgi:CHASE2 domain-containing sensor protein